MRGASNKQGGVIAKRLAGAHSGDFFELGKSSQRLCDLNVHEMRCMKPLIRCKGPRFDLFAKFRSQQKLHHR